jgi:hypothetical protein
MKEERKPQDLIAPSGRFSWRDSRPGEKLEDEKYI